MESANVIQLNNTTNTEQVADNQPIGKSQEETPNQKKEQKQKLNFTNRSYTKEQLHDTIRNKYQEHQKYYGVIQGIVNQIIEQESKELDKVIDALSTMVEKMENISIAELEKYAIQIPVFMYRLNTRLGKKGLEANISNHLKNFEITSNLMGMKGQGGSGPERQRVAEYNAMIPTFTTEIKSQVYLNLKTKMDLAKTVNDGVKKALSAQIEEMKLSGGNRHQP